MSKITYDDKSYLNLNSNIPNVNKVTDADMNEIKNVVNDNDDAFYDETYYSTGDIVEIGGATAQTEYVASGYISSASQSIFITIITPKKLDNITSIAVNSVRVEGRCISGYLNDQSQFNEYVGAANYTIIANIVSSNSITIRINKSSAFTSGGNNVQNNSPIVLNGYFKFTLT